MFGLSTLVQMNRRAAAQMKGKVKLGFCAENPLAPKSEAVKTKEFEQELRSQASCVAEPREDFTVVSQGPNGGLLVTPTNDGAKAFLKKMFAYSDDYRGASVILKHRDWPSLLFTIEAAGMTASRK